MHYSEYLLSCKLADDSDKTISFSLPIAVDASEVPHETTIYLGQITDTKTISGVSMGQLVKFTYNFQYTYTGDKQLIDFDFDTINSSYTLQPCTKIIDGRTCKATFIAVVPAGIAPTTDTVTCVCNLYTLGEAETTVAKELNTIYQFIKR